MAILKEDGQGGRRKSKRAPKTNSPMIKPALIIKRNGKMYGAMPMTLEEYRSPNRKIKPDLSKPLGQKKIPTNPSTSAQKKMAAKKMAMKSRGRKK